MIAKIISGGQTGADRAALDVAIELGIPHGGWVPKGRMAEDGVLPKKYKLKEVATENYADRTEKNVLESDGTLIISRGKLSGGSSLTRTLAIQHRRPWLHVDLFTTNAFKAAQDIKMWMIKSDIKIINIAGPRASQDPQIYKVSKDLLKTVFYLNLTETERPPLDQFPPSFPRTAKEAIERLKTELSLKDKTFISRMEAEELVFLRPSLGEYILNQFGLGHGNRELLHSCRSMSGNVTCSREGASSFIISELWKSLRKTHLLRLA